MDFDQSKENIQPLRGGRNVSQLGVALQAQSDTDHQNELLQKKSEFEKLIQNYNGDDPLENWFNYILWIEQSYPKHGHEGNMATLLEYCLKMFENDKRYSDDRRLCKLFIKYIDFQQNPLELYHMMYAQGLCRGCADMYRAWAYYYEAAGDFQSAHKIFEWGKRALAQPFEDLQHAHQNLVIAAGQHIIYGPNEVDLMDKRNALTSLRTLKSGQVGSIRNSATSGSGLPYGSSVATHTNISVPIYEDQGNEMNGVAIGPNSIVTAAKRQEVPKENTLKPGPWTNVAVKKRQVTQKVTPSFTVHEDCDEASTAANCTNFVSSTLENYSDWIVSLTVPEAPDHRVIPVYPKLKVYSEINTEYSLEELRAKRYFPNKTIIGANKEITCENAIISTSFNNQNKSKLGQDVFKNSPYKEHHEQNENVSALLGTTEGINSNRVSPKMQLLNSFHSPAPTESNKKQNPNFSYFDVWSPPEGTSPEVASKNAFGKRSTPARFDIYEQSDVAYQEQTEPKGSAMKTPFKDLNAEELAETGSRGGMDTAAAAPVDSARRLPIFDEDSNSSFDKNYYADVSCNTQMFAINLNAMKVSTPQNKQELVVDVDADEESMKNARKQLFMETTKTVGEKTDKALSPILEETKSYGHSSSSGSSGTSTKNSLFTTNHTSRHNNMATISEERHSYLAQNLSVNAALRSSSLGDLMDLGNHSNQRIVPEPKQTDTSQKLSLAVASAPLQLTQAPSDPFKQSLIDHLLEKLSFPGPHTRGYYYLNSIPRLMARKETINIGSDKYVVEKQLGKGTYGTVFRGVDLKTNALVALKYQKPANRWEFYVCRELQARLKDHPLRERFMDVSRGYFCDQSSVLISEFMPCGSLLDVANMVKQKSGRSMKESLCIHFCLEMLKVVQAMHEVKIVHADIKPDNFLVQLFPNDTVGLHLIDFGCSIDLSLFPDGTKFTRKVTTENFICCEMLDDRPWSYHTDLFCIASTAHVLLFEKYMLLQKTNDHWSISIRFPRYARVDLWNMFFSTLLNQQNGPADSTTLQAMLEESLHLKYDEYYSELRFLTNILKNR